MTKDFQNYFQGIFNHKDYKNTGNLGQQPVPKFMPSKLQNHASPNSESANYFKEVERTWPGTAANPPVSMPEKSLLTREQLVRLNEHLPDKDKIQFSPEKATMSLQNPTPQALDLGMTDAEAAQVLAHHTATLEAEAEETTRWLNEHGIDTSEGIEVDIEQAVRKAAADGEDMFDQAEKIKIMVARRASAVLVLRALGVAAMHTDAVFKGMITEAAVVAKAEPRRAIFDAQMGDAHVESTEPPDTEDSEDLLKDKEARNAALRANIERLKDELKAQEELLLKHKSPVQKSVLEGRIDKIKANMSLTRSELGLSDEAADSKYGPDLPHNGHESWFAGQQFKKLSNAKRETFEVYDVEEGKVDALSVSEVRRKRQRRNGTGSTQDDPVVL